MDIVFSPTATAGSIIGGLVITLIMPVIKSKINESQTTLKFAVTVVLSLIVALIVMAIDGNITGDALTPAKFFLTVTSVLGWSQAIYRFITEPSGTDKSIEKTAKKVI